MGHGVFERVYLTQRLGETRVCSFQLGVHQVVVQFQLAVLLLQLK